MPEKLQNALKEPMQLSNSLDTSHLNRETKKVLEKITSNMINEKDKAFITEIFANIQNQEKVNAIVNEMKNMKDIDHAVIAYNPETKRNDRLLVTDLSWKYEVKNQKDMYLGDVIWNPSVKTSEYAALNKSSKLETKLVIEKAQEIKENSEKIQKKLTTLEKQNPEFAKLIEMKPELKDLVREALQDFNIDQIKVNSNGSISLIDNADNKFVKNVWVRLRNMMRVFKYLAQTLTNEKTYMVATNALARSLTGHDVLVFCPDIDKPELRFESDSKDKGMLIEEKIKKESHLRSEKEVLSALQFVWSPAKAFEKGSYEFTEDFNNSIKIDAISLNSYVDALKEYKQSLQEFEIRVKAGIDSQNYDPTISPDRTNLLMKEAAGLEKKMKSQYPDEYSQLQNLMILKAYERNIYDQKLLFVRAAKPFLALVQQVKPGIKVRPDFDITVWTSKDKEIMKLDRKVDISFTWPKKDITVVRQMPDGIDTFKKTIVHLPNGKILDTNWQKIVEKPTSIASL